MKKVVTKTFCFIASAVVLWSCKKDTIPAPNPAWAQLEVVLNETYMPAAKIDSAVAIWEVNGSAQTVKLQVAGNKLTASLAQLSKAGAGTLAVQLYTQTKAYNQSLQWEKRFAYTLNRTTPVQLAAPVSIKDPSWNPRLIARSDIYMAHFTAIIALRPEDAYFELKDVAPGIAQRIEVVRSFYQNDRNTLVASRGWVGDASKLDGKGNLTDRNHFSNLAEQIDGRAWNKYLVRASFFSQLEPHQIVQFDIFEDKL
jgi:hypothetical protein